MLRAPVPFFGCGGTPHGRGSFAERTVSGGRLSGRGKGVAKQAGVARGGPLFTICTKRGVGTWWRRNLSGTVSVTWRSVPGGCRREGWKESGMAGVPSQREGTGQDGGRKREGRGSLAMGRNGPGRKGESGMAGVPSQWEGTGCQQGRKRSRSRRLVRERDWKRNWSRNRNALCRLCAVLLLPRPRHGRTARGRRLSAGAVGELGSARSPGIAGRKKHGFRGGFGGCG
jgi:hypothetical protein